MLLLQIAVSASIWWATSNADLANAASNAAGQSIALLDTALGRLSDTQLCLADFLRTGDAVDRARLNAALGRMDEALKAVAAEGGAQAKLTEAAPAIRSRLDAAVAAAMARREILANIIAIVTRCQNALVAISVTGSQAASRATADTTAAAITAAFRPMAAIGRYLATEDHAEEANAVAGLGVLDTALRAILSTAPETPPRLRRLVNAGLFETGLLEPALAEFHHAIATRAESLLSLRGSVTELTESLRRYMRTVSAGRADLGKKMQLARARVRLNLMWAGALGGLLGGGIAMVIGLSITRPLGRLSDSMGRLAAGALNIIVPDRARRDEVGRMARAMEVFKESMNRNVELKAAEGKLLTVNAQLEELARLDGLTGLANRRSFDETLDREFLHCARDKLPLSLILIDVDRFKVYNDTYGHQAGDGCLRELSLAVKRWARRPLDLAARYGGEELGVLLPDTDNEAAASIAERIRLAIRELEIPHSGNPNGVVTVSLGVATIFPSAGEAQPADIVKSADQFLYAAKAQGRDRVTTERTPSVMACRKAE